LTQIAVWFCGTCGHSSLVLHPAVQKAPVKLDPAGSVDVAQVKPPAHTSPALQTA
jgi:hypothetical protein